MLWFKKLQEDARGIFKEHPASIVSVFVFAVCTALLEDILNVGIIAAFGRSLPLSRLYP